MDSTIKQKIRDLSEKSIADEEKSDNNSSISAISLYLQEISQYPTLTIDEEQELAKRISNGDEVAKDLFIKKIFDNHEYEIVSDRRKKVKTIDEIEAMKGKKKNNMELK